MTTKKPVFPPDDAVCRSMFPASPPPPRKKREFDLVDAIPYMRQIEQLQRANKTLTDMVNDLLDELNELKTQQEIERTNR